MIALSLKPVPVVLLVFLLPACHPPQPSPQDELIARGRQLFTKGTFNGNGRTCATCHPANNNLTIDPAFIATLPPDDPLFVAETNPNLRQNFENPKLMREFGLIQENLDGFGDLENKFVMRGVPHTLGLRTSIASPQGPRTGWSGDGAPGDGSLRSFATGAVIQHFTKTLNRVPDVDFRLPTNAELDALEAFQLSLGRQQELQLPLPLRGTIAKRGQAIFMDNSLGKCNICHSNAGANAVLGGQNAGNRNFNTGVENLPDQPARLTNERVPFDDGFGTPGDSTFNTPPLIEAAESGPFFHNNAIETIEGAVAFYDGESFNNSPSGRFLGGIELDGTQIVEIAAFLRVLNALENIRQSIQFLQESILDQPPRVELPKTLIAQAAEETGDAIRVLAGGGLHPDAVAHLKEAEKLTLDAAKDYRNIRLIEKAVRAHEQARTILIE